MGGNVSLYNETEGGNIYPTPTVAMVGLLEKGQEPVTSFFKNKGDFVYLIGENREEPEGRVPHFDFQEELIVQELCRAAAAKQLLRSAHDISEGGLAVTLAECCFANDGAGLGAEIELKDKISPDALLFGESPSRIVVSVAPAREKDFLDLAEHLGCKAAKIGVVGGERLMIKDWINIPVKELYVRYCRHF